MSTQGPTGRLPLLPGAAAGVGAWLLGYLSTFLLTAGEIRDSPVRQVIEALGGDLPTWKVVGWVFYNAHFSNTVFEGLFGGARSFVGGDAGFTPLLFVVPPLLLVAAGLAVGRAVGVTDLRGAAAAGVTLVAGYGALSVVGLVLFALEGAHPEYVTGVLLVGLVYPVVFGVAGAALAAQ